MNRSTLWWGFAYTAGFLLVFFSMLFVLFPPTHPLPGVLQILFSLVVGLLSGALGMHTSIRLDEARRR